MIETFEFPDGGRVSGRRLKDQTLTGGRNGVSICRAIMITDMGDYLVLRPVTSLGTAKANTFIDVPADPDLLEHIGRHLMVAAGKIRRERCDAAYQAAIETTRSEADQSHPTRGLRSSVID